MLQDGSGNVSNRQSDFNLAYQFQDRLIDHQWGKCRSVKVTIFRGFKRQRGGAVRCVSAGFPRRRLDHLEQGATLKPVQNCGEEKRDHNLEMSGNVIALSAFHRGTANNVCERTIMGDKVHIHRREIAHGVF